MFFFLFSKMFYKRLFYNLKRVKLNTKCRYIHINLLSISSAMSLEIVGVDRTELNELFVPIYTNVHEGVLM